MPKNVYFYWLPSVVLRFRDFMIPFLGGVCNLRKFLDHRDRWHARDCSDVDKWWYSDVDKWRCSDVDKWRCSDVDKWRCSDVDKWRCGRTQAMLLRKRSTFDNSVPSVRIAHHYVDKEGTNKQCDGDTCESQESPTSEEHRSEMREALHAARRRVGDSTSSCGGQQPCKSRTCIVSRFMQHVVVWGTAALQE